MPPSRGLKGGGGGTEGDLPFPMNEIGNKKLLKRQKACQAHHEANSKKNKPEKRQKLKKKRKKKQ